MLINKRPLQDILLSSLISLSLNAAGSVTGHETSQTLTVQNLSKSMSPEKETRSFLAP